MSIKAHIADLEVRHRMLEAELATARAHASIDHLQIVELKRRKLLVKDKIAKLRATLDAAEAAAGPGPATRPLPCKRCGGWMSVVRSIPQLGPELPEVCLFQCNDCGDVLTAEQPSANPEIDGARKQSWLRTLASGSLVKQLTTP